MRNNESANNESAKLEKYETTNVRNCEGAKQRKSERAKVRNNEAETLRNNERAKQRKCETTKVRKYETGACKFIFQTDHGREECWRKMDRV